MPLVSIVTPSLDQGRFLEDAIVSVLEQDYPRIEHIVVDGGSTDETIDVLNRYPHVHWVSEPDGGQAPAINKGFRMAHGEIYSWLNADDYLLPGAVSAAVSVLTTTGCALVHGGWRQVGEDGTILGDVPPLPFEFSRQLEVANGVCQPGSFFTRASYWSVGGVDETYRYAMDYELWLKLGSRYQIRHVDRIQAAYRYHAESKSIASYDAFGPETLRASRRHGGRFFSPMYVDYYLPRMHPRLHRLLRGARLIAKGRLRELVSRLVVHASSIVRRA